MTDELFETLAQLYADECEAAQGVLIAHGMDSEEYHMTVGRRSGYLKLASKFGKYSALNTRMYEILKERKGN